MTDSDQSGIGRLELLLLWDARIMAEANVASDLLDLGRWKETVIRLEPDQDIRIPYDSPFHDERGYRLFLPDTRFELRLKRREVLV